MSEEQKGKNDLATNRLLDLLRSKQVGEETKAPKTPPPKEKDTAPRETQKELTAEPEAVPASPAEKTVLQRSETEPGTKSLLDSLAKSKLKAEEPAKEATADDAVKAEPVKTQVDDQETPQLIPEPAGTDSIPELIPEPAGDEASASQVIPEPAVIEKPSPEPAPVPEDILQSIQTPSVEQEKEEVVEIEPVEFDKSLLSAAPVKKEKLDIQDYVNTIFHLFNESSRRITLHRGEKNLRLVQLKTGFQGTEIEKFKEYSLPYPIENKTINDMDSLVAHVLENELDAKEKRYAYGAIYSSQMETRTHMLETPKLKNKELVDLVEWNAKKNLPFSAEKAVMDWEKTEAVGAPDKHNIVIGIVEEDPVVESIEQFKDKKLKLRLSSTLPILLWKLFMRNYPDRKSGTYVLIHIGENHTTVAVVTNLKLLFSREIAVGVDDFYKAVIQKVNVGDKSIEIDYDLGKQLLMDYGIPKDTGGVAVGSHIDLYKVSIFLRPVMERLTSELNRSLNFFKKQNPTLNWNELLFSGVGVTLPNLVPTLGMNLNLKVGLLNPLREGIFLYPNGEVMSDSLLPKYTVNFALASDEAETINIIPKKIRSSYKYIFWYKVAAVTLAIMIPIYVITGILSGMKVKNQAVEIVELNRKWDALSVQAKEYLDYMKDIEILGAFRSFLEYDRRFSKNQIKLLKILSSATPGDIKLHYLNFKKEVVGETRADNGLPQHYQDVLAVGGFVEADASVSDLHLTNYVMVLNQMEAFRNVKMKIDENSDPQEGRLHFTLDLSF